MNSNHYLFVYFLYFESVLSSFSKINMTIQITLLTKHSHHYFTTTVNRLDPMAIHTVAHINTAGNPKKQSKLHVNKSLLSSMLHPKKSYSHLALLNPTTFPSKELPISMAVLAMGRKNTSLQLRRNINVSWIHVVV